MTHFNLELPLKKSYTDDNGEYHIAFSISTTEKDSYGDFITENALNSMLRQAKDITINANHQHDLNSIIGPVHDAWIEKKDDTSYLYVDVHVRQDWEKTIKDLLQTGIALGGSIEAEIVNTSHTEENNMVIDDLRLYGAALTTIPANGATLGTATNVAAGCPGSMCMQLSKQLHKKNIDLEVGKLTKNEEKTGSKEEIVNEDNNNADTLLETISTKIDNVLNKLTTKTSFEEEPEKGELEEDNLKEKLELEKKNLELEKVILGLKTENKKLQNSIITKKQEKLVNKALKLNKKLDPDTQIINKELLLDEVKSLSNTMDNRDVYLQLESYTKGLELASKKIPKGDLPNIISDNFVEAENKYSKSINNHLKEINKPLIK